GEGGVGWAGGGGGLTSGAGLWVRFVLGPARSIATTSTSDSFVALWPTSATPRSGITSTRRSKRYMPKDHRGPVLRRCAETRWPVHAHGSRAEQSPGPAFGNVP